MTTIVTVVVVAIVVVAAVAPRIPTAPPTVRVSAKVHPSLDGEDDNRP